MKIKKDKKPIELHNYIIRISDDSFGNDTQIFEIKITTPKITFRFLKTLLDLIEKYGR